MNNVKKKLHATYTHAVCGPNGIMMINVKVVAHKTSKNNDKYIEIKQQNQ